MNKDNAEKTIEQLRKNTLDHLEAARVGSKATTSGKPAERQRSFEQSDVKTHEQFSKIVKEITKQIEKAL